MPDTLLQHQPFLVSREVIQIHHPGEVGGGRCHDWLAISRGRMTLRECRAPRIPAGSPLHRRPRVELKPCPPPRRGVPRGHLAVAGWATWSGVGGRKPPAPAGGGCLCRLRRGEPYGREGLESLLVERTLPDPGGGPLRCAGGPSSPLRPWQSGARCQLGSRKIAGHATAPPAAVCDQQGAA
eukprot:1938985-Rhodomonas_salina.2